MTTSSLVWRQIIPPLSNQHTVIVPDLLGFGDSEKSHDCDFSIPAQARIIDELCKQLGFKSISIVAHDLGAGVAMYLMHVNPELVEAFITLNTSNSEHWLIPPMKRIRDCDDESLQEKVEKLFFLGMKRALHRDTLIDDNVLQAYFKPFAGKAGALHFQRIVRSLKPEHLREAEVALNGKAVKTLILWGLEDQNLSVTIAEGIAKLLPQSELRLIESAGHFPQEDNPQFVVRAVQSFLGD